MTGIPQTPIYRAPIYHKPRFTAAISFPQIGLNMHIVNKKNPDLPRTPIYCGCFLSPKLSVNAGFTVLCSLMTRLEDGGFLYTIVNLNN